MVFFHANLRRLPQVGYRVSYDASGKVLTALENNEADLGVISPPADCPRRCGSRIGSFMASRSSGRRTQRGIPTSRPSVPGWTGAIDKTGCYLTNRETPADGCALG